MTRYLPLALCLLILPAWAGLYKWTDENGKVHYSDQPPPGDVKKSETIKQPSPAPTAPAVAGAKPSAAAKTPAEQEMEFRRRRLEAAEAEAKAKKDAQDAEDKKRNCERATAQVASLQRGGRVTRPGPNGEQIYLNDDEIAKELINARRSADSWCK
ncbi:MAG TPA: DUF4124 domain-containing protein [Burkholderiales bacterium]|nr:DUF4124 domain-containing protein [Burkholderiales bacterium]